MRVTKDRVDLTPAVRWLRWMDFAERTISRLIWLAIAIVASNTIATISGKTTVADLGVNVVADIRISEAVAYGLGVLGFGYGLKQRKMRKRSVREQSKRITDLETQIDPARSSSELTDTGDTRPEDE